MDTNTARDRLLKRGEVEARLNLKTTALYAAMRRGAIPRPILLGPRCLRWSEQELERRIAALQSANGDGIRRAS